MAIAAAELHDLVLVIPGAVALSLTGILGWWLRGVMASRDARRARADDASPCRSTRI